MLVAQCPSCKRIHNAPKEIDGKKVKCKDCGHSFIAKVVDYKGQLPPAAAKPPAPPQTTAVIRTTASEEIPTAMVGASAMPFPSAQAAMEHTPSDTASGQKLSAMCPNCNICHDVSFSKVGMEVQCPSCQTFFIVRAQIDDLSPEMLASIPTGLAAVADSGDDILLPESEQRLFSGYRAIQTLGTGTDSTVWKVLGKDESESFALKQVIKKDDKTVFDQAENEFEIASKLNHRNIRKVHEIFRIKQLLSMKEMHLVMECCVGKSLQDYTTSNMITLIQIFIETGKGLAYLHSQGLVHCDLTPENIIVSPEGLVKIIDLGQCCPNGTTKSKSDKPLIFAAPEQIIGRPVDKRTDTYSFGAVFYWALTHQTPPMVGDNRQDKLEETMGTLPVALRRMLMMCLELNPLQRPLDINDLIPRLTAIAEKLAQPRQG